MGLSDRRLTQKPSVVNHKYLQKAFLHPLWQQRISRSCGNMRRRRASSVSLHGLEASYWMIFSGLVLGKSGDEVAARYFLSTCFLPLVVSWGKEDSPRDIRFSNKRG